MRLHPEAIQNYNVGELYDIVCYVDFHDDTFEASFMQGTHSVHYSLFFIMYNILYTICNTIEAVHYWTKQTQKWPKK